MRQWLGFKLKMIHIDDGCRRTRQLKTKESSIDDFIRRARITKTKERSIDLKNITL